MRAACFTCHRDPAGYPANPYSAYCGNCQPHGRPAPKTAFSGCSRCGQVFGTLASFDGHLVRDAGLAVILACAPPRALGLVPDRDGTWQTPDGLAARERTRQMAADWNASRQQASSRASAPAQAPFQGAFG